MANLNSNPNPNPNPISYPYADPNPNPYPNPELKWLCTGASVSKSIEAEITELQKELAHDQKIAKDFHGRRLAAAAKQQELRDNAVATNLAKRKVGFSKVNGCDDDKENKADIEMWLKVMSTELEKTKCQLESFLEVSAPPVLYHWDEIERATEKFIEAAMIDTRDRPLRTGNAFLAKFGNTMAVVKRVEGLFADSEIPGAEVMEKIANLRNAGLVQILGFSSRLEVKGIISEFMSGGSLLSKMERKERNLNWKQRVGIASSVSVGLAFLHTRDPPILHGRINMANIALEKDQYKGRICDYAISTLCGEALYNRILTDYYVDCDPVVHVDPNVYTEGDELTLASDVYSFGIILLYLLFGELPPQGPYDAVLSGITNAKQLLKALDPKAGAWGVSEAAVLHQTCMHCLQPQAHMRPEMAEVKQQLSVLVPGLKRSHREKEEIVTLRNGLR